MSKPEGSFFQKWSQRSAPLSLGLASGTRWNMSTRVPSGVGRWAPLRALLEHSRTVPLLHFSLGFKDSGRLLARRARSHRGGSRVGLLPPSSFSSPLPRPPRAAHVRLPFARLRSGRSLPGAHSESPIPHGIPVPRYSARRTRALHSDPKVRALNSSGPGFSPVARFSCRVVLRSCFRPGTRLGLPRLPPRATSHLVRDQEGPSARPGCSQSRLGPR
jgi:hypothetical protein